MKKIQDIVILLSVIAGACNQQNGISQIDSLMNQLYEQGDFNGAVIISENNEQVYSKGFGYADFEKQIPFKTSTTMDAGSITKTFTALSIQMLEQENLLSLNDPVVDHISSFPYNDIKIKHLVNHTSGLVTEDFVLARSKPGIVLNNAFFLEALETSIPPLNFEPGSQFQYNGINYMLLAMIIENTSGNRFDEYIRGKIAEPLEINDWFLRPARLSDWTRDRTKVIN
jgi:CubicO group peptidase (beta-lactamase class C family)